MFETINSELLFIAMATPIIMTFPASYINTKLRRCIWQEDFFPRYLLASACSAHAPNSNTIYEKKTLPETIWARRVVNKAPMALLYPASASFWCMVIESRLKSLAARSHVGGMRMEKWPECLPDDLSYEWMRRQESTVLLPIWHSFCIEDSLDPYLSSYDRSTYVLEYFKLCIFSICQNNMRDDEIS